MCKHLKKKENISELPIFGSNISEDIFMYDIWRHNCKLNIRI